MDQKPKKLPSQKHTGDNIRINSDTQPRTRKGGSLFGLAALVAATGSGSAALDAASHARRRAPRGPMVHKHVSRRTLAGEPHTSTNKLRPATRKARRNHRRAMRNRMGYR